MALPGVSSETRLVKIAFSPQAAFTALSILGSSAAGQENAIRPENFQPVMSANVNEKMPKIDTLDALEDHAEHDNDYQTNSNRYTN